MRKELHRHRLIPFAVCLLLAVACRQNELSPPGPPASIEVLSGDGQLGTVGAALPDQIVVKVVDANDRGVPDIAVIFEAADGSGGAAPSQVTTDVNGVARTMWTMSTTDNCGHSHIVTRGDTPSIRILESLGSGSLHTSLTRTAALASDRSAML